MPNPASAASLPEHAVEGDRAPHRGCDRDDAARGASERGLQWILPMANKAGYAFAWLLGIPLPILLIVYLVSRC
jgi:hypothetical protein